MTAKEFLALPEDPYGKRRELIDGVIVVSEARLAHGVVQARIVAELYGWVEGGDRRGLVSTPTDVPIDERNVFSPDVLWIAQDHVPADLQELLARVPDLCVEVRSPSTWRRDTGVKKAGYERRGLPELWLVDDVERRVLVFRRSRPESPTFDVSLELTAGDALGSPQLPGFELPLDRLFRE